MSDALNSRLFGHTYEMPGGGRKVTVCESMPGLAEGYVTVMEDDGRKHNEKLSYVLSTIENPEQSFRTAASILGHAGHLRTVATELAAMAVSNELPPETEAILAEIDVLLERVTNRCARGARKAKKALASACSTAPSP